METRDRAVTGLYCRARFSVSCLVISGNYVYETSINYDNKDQSVQFQVKETVERVCTAKQMQASR